MRKPLLKCLLGTLLTGCAFHQTTPPKMPEQRVMTHIIKVPGETLGLIAKWYTGSAAHWRELVQATPGLKANQLQIGQQVNIPDSLVTNRKPLPKSYVVKLNRAAVSEITSEGAIERDPTPLRLGAISEGTSSESDRKLFDAIMFADLRRVNELLASGANPNSGENGRPLLGWAAQNGSVEIVRALLAQGAVVNALDTSGYSPLMRAVISNQEPIVVALVAAGADIGIVAYDGQTALDLANRQGNQTIIRLLANGSANK